MDEKTPVQIFRFHCPQGFRLGLEVDGERFDLNASAREFSDISSWLALADPVAAIHSILPRARSFPLTGEVGLAAPLDVQEVWASGVTYLRSKIARIEESAGGGDFYDLVYQAERPELFFKSMAHRVVGNGQPVRIRRDSAWNVPEPELALVLSAAGMIVGYTIGNDMSSRSIEGENPLYLPQAKVYDGSCSLGPGILLRDGDEIPRDIHMIINRQGSAVFEGTTSTTRIRRPLTELADYLFREMTFSNGVFLLTGTGIVPPDDFTLHPGDKVSITIEGIGTLENIVE
ncbi:MAG TPA: fumarylacetoacetate hydrolase family protein [Pyrinomonadaceae bacterium]|nr:fumarylacetoacetate hydrolase family protein [Pyrinomonadaceae bacterium]